MDLTDPDLDVISRQLVQTNASLATIRAYLGIMVLAFAVVALLVLTGTVQLEIRVSNRF